MSALRVSIVEGDAGVRDGLTTLMALDGCEVAAYGSVRAFLDVVSGWSAQCVICAANLPDGSGLGVYLAIKPRNPRARFALLLDGPSPGVAAAARAHGVDAVFRKPLLNHDLRRFVRATPGRVR